MGALAREPQLWMQPLGLSGGRKQGRGLTVSQCCPLTPENHSRHPGEVQQNSPEEVEGTPPSH